MDIWPAVIQLYNHFLWKISSNLNGVNPRPLQLSLLLLNNISNPILTSTRSHPFHFNARDWEPIYSTKRRLNIGYWGSSALELVRTLPFSPPRTSTQFTLFFSFPPFLNFYLYKTLITLNKLNALIHIARLIDNPDTFADNLRTSIFRLKLKQTKQPCPVWENRFCDVMVQGMSSDAWDEFSKTILERCLIICLWNPLLGSLCVIKKDLCTPCGGSF